MSVSGKAEKLSILDTLSLRYHLDVHSKPAVGNLGLVIRAKM